ncbi:MAG: glycoside hydrolase family 28 protein [Candidatus Anaerobiospirillum merdipullorum]|uniref:Glycoside hydrolase family 28 protein n=1 Tax=Candidatus Anaerobiospirillum merdipullorum TaxID=2838450 RepID=A0A9E2NU16_9GAMM|nr:glycoside hydrolase family 28 protein [Candidatus Anaerobiospirillum merdipullorum]
MTLNVQAGAVLKADNSEKKFVAAYIGKPAAPHEAFILANKAQNVKLIGSGTIDGDGEHSWWPEALEVRKAVRSGNTALFEKRFPGVKLANGMPRPWLVEFNEVEGGVIYGLNFVNSPMLNLVIRNCNDVLLDSVKVTAPVESPNTDGVDIVSSKYVTVINSEIYTGDDNVAIKSGVDQVTAGPSENIVIKDSLFREGHGVSIGSETANGIGRLPLKTASSSTLKTASASNQRAIAAIRSARLTLMASPWIALIRRSWSPFPMPGNPGLLAWA